MADRLTALELIAADSLHTEEERQIRAVVARLVDDKVRPHVAGWYERGARVLAGHPSGGSRREALLPEPLALDD